MEMGRISYSQLSLYNECPMHWKLRYVDKVSIDKSSIHLIFGSAMHTTLQMYLDTMYRESIKIADALDLSEILEEKLIKEFKEAEKKYGTKPCKFEDINEFFNDGIFIIDWFKKHRAEYFNKRNWKLIGCEVPLNVELKNNIRFIGFIDIIMHHVPTNRYKIIDIKTSTWGWNKYQKRDKNKTAQLLLYKQFFAKQNNCTVEDIDVEYFIVKRKLWENTDFPQKRVQIFVPSSGIVSMNKVNKSLHYFIESAFDAAGKHKGVGEPTPSKKACRWCEFNQTEYCTVGVK
jgi:hypothetical protein